MKIEMQREKAREKDENPEIFRHSFIVSGIKISNQKVVF